MCERELETEQNCNLSTPTLIAITVFLSRSPELLNQGPEGAASLGHGPHSSIFSPTAQSGVLRAPSAGCWFSLPHLISNYLTSCLHPGYIIIWRPFFFLRVSQFHTQFNLSTVKAISWHSSTRCTCYLHKCISYFDSLAGVNMLHNSLHYFFYLHTVKWFSVFLLFARSQMVSNISFVCSQLNGFKYCYIIV